VVLDERGKRSVLAPVSVATPVENSGGEHRRLAEARPEAVVPCEPRVVARVVARDVRGVTLEIAEGVAGAEHVQRHAASGSEVVLRLGEEIVVPRPDRIT